MDGRCENCRRWEFLDYPVVITDRDGFPSVKDDEGYTDDADNQIEAPGAWGRCRMPGFHGPHDTTTRAYVEDASIYAASLYTRNDFACADYQPTEETQ